MKILHITTHLNTGGITTYLQALVKEQTRAGHEVYLWASSGVCLDDFRSMTREVVSDVPRCKSELSPRLWSQLPRLISYVRKQKIDVIHTHTRVAQVLAAASKFFTRVPFLSTAHMFYKKRLGRILYPCWGSAIIANSKTMKDGLTDIFGEKNLPPVTVVVNGIDVEGLRMRVKQVDRRMCRKDYGFCDEEIVILSLSRLIPVKGVHFLIEAFALVARENPFLRLLVAGSGEPDYKQRLEDQVNALGIREKIRFLGNVTQTEKVFAAADLFVAPYLWPEAFGLSILEAMAAGLPVAGSRSGGIGELLGQGKYGLLFDEKDVEGLSKCLEGYARDPDLRLRMARAGHQAASRYTALNMYQQTQNVYEQVVGQG